VSNIQPLPPAPAPTPAPNQGGFWNDIKNLPGEAVKAVTNLPVVGKAIGTALSWANKPLQEVQKDYKFIHSLYADHGFIDGTIGSLGVLAGAGISIAGALAAPETGGASLALTAEGAALGAGIGETVERNILGRATPAFKDSFQKSNDPSYLVSFGRDTANLASKIPGFSTLANTDTGVGQIVSGIADASFDFEADPLAVAGKLKGQIRNGDNIAVAKEVDPTTGEIKTSINPQTGKPIAQATLPFASSATGLQNFFLANSMVVHSADQLDSVLASPFSGGINRAIDDITAKAKESPKTAIADITNTYGVKNGWSRPMVNALANVTNREQVVQIFKQAMYSKELADNANQATAELRLPSKSVGKLLSEKIGPERIKNSAQGTTFNDQVNLLIPRKSAVTDPATGAPVINPTTGEQVFKMNAPALFKPGNGAVMNALAAKVRTFTGRRPLSFDKDEMALSSKQIDLSDPNIGQTIYDIAYLSMPHKIALERASDFLTAANNEDRLSKLHTLHQEVLKNFGIADSQATPLFSQLKDASVGSEADHGVYAVNGGRDVGTVDMKPEYSQNPKSMAIVVGQRYKGAMLDLKDIRNTLRETKAYGALYSPVDDFFTKYTNVIFAPLALLSPAFGLRVSTGEALHQVMRRGLPSYLSNVLSNVVNKMSKAHADHYLDKTAMKLTETDKDAIEAEQADRLPQGLTFKTKTSKEGIKEVTPAFGKPGQPFSVPEQTIIRNIHQVTVHDENGKEIANLNWRISDGEITHIGVDSEYQRKGIATSMLAKAIKIAKEQNLKIPQHSENLTEAGKLWKEATEKAGLITSNEVTEELNNKENRIKKAYDTAQGAISSKAAWNKAVNNVASARGRLLPAGWEPGKFSKSRLVSYLVKDKIKLMDEYEDVLGTREPTAGVSSSHGASQDMAAKDAIDMFTKTRGHSNVPGQELAGLTSQDPHFHDYLAKNINMAGADQAQRDIARDYLNRMKNPEFQALSSNDKFASLVDAQANRIKNPNMYKDYRSTMDGYSKAVPESFAKSQVDYLQGVVHGSNDTIHTDLIQKIAKGEQVTGKELRQLPQESLPIKVLGRRMQPRISDALRQVEEKGYRKFVNPVMDFISRQPLFNDFYIRRRMSNQPLIDMGLLSPDEAVRLSALQATKEMIPAIHSPAIRSQFAVIHRNLLPFYFAQEQAMRRTGRLILSRPQAFRDFQIIQQGMNNPGFVHTDANGQKYIVYPVLGEFGNALARGLNAIDLKQFSGLPESITGNTSSLLTVLPEVKMPGTSPFINLGLNKLSNMFPWMDKAVNLASGGYPSQNIIDTIIPNSTMRDMFNAMTMDDRESTVLNSKLSAIASAYYHGDLPENFTSLPAFQQAQIMAKIEGNAKSNLIIKGLFSFFLPLAPTVSNDVYDKNLQTLRSDYLALLNQKDPLTNQTYSAAAALNKFIQDTGSPSNPNRALAYTVARSQNGTSGAYVPLADSTISWIDGNQKLLNNPAYSSASPYLIPQVADSADALAVENKLLLDHFRSKVTSQQFLTSLYVKQGWQDLASSYAAYQTVLTDARKSNNRQAEYNIGQAWKQITANYGQSNPVWFANYNDPTRPVQSAKVISQFQTMNQKGLLPNTPEGNGIKDLLANYQYYHNGLLANTINGQHLPGYSTLMDVWYTYVDNLAVSNPRLQSVITSVFRRAV